METLEISFWGEVVPNWLAAIGTICAAGVAVGVVWVEHMRQERFRDEQRWAQARRVSFSVGRGGSSRVDDDPPVARLWESVEFRNGCDQQVRDVDIFIEAEPTLTLEYADSPRIELSNTTPFGTVHPEGMRQTEVAVVVPVFIDGLVHHETRVWAEFTDDAGLRWRRGKDGSLVLLGAPTKGKPPS